MKFASLKSPTNRDGELCLVSRDLQIATSVKHVVPTLQSALERWDEVREELENIYQKLNDEHADAMFIFDSKMVASPLPRAFQWADGSAYLNHVELVRKARGAEMPKNFWTDPLIYQGCSDAFLGPTDPILVEDEAYGVDFEAEVAIITADVPMAVKVENASQYIRLFLLVNDVSLRNLIPNEIAKGFGFFQSKPASSFSPVAVTPDELYPFWDEERLHLPLESYLNDELFGNPNAGTDMTFSFPQLIAHAAKTRNLAAGSIIGSGTVSNSDPNRGSSCIVERRMIEVIEHGKAKTPFMRFGDTVKIDMPHPKGNSIFGAIEQQVAPYAL